MQEHFSNKELAIIPIAAFTASGEIKQHCGVEVALNANQILGAVLG